MTFTSTRSNCSVTSLEAILRGLAPDGGLFVPSARPAPTGGDWATLADAERAALGSLFDDVPETVREDAIRNLLAKFPADDPVPLVDANGLKILELFHGPTGAFKDVALSVLPVLMVAAAQGKRVLILTATSGDTGSAAMAGFANVPGVEIAVFFPNTGTSRIQRLQMTTPSAPNVHGIAIRGNFDDAQAAVKRIFADPQIRAEAEDAGITLSSANSINIGRLVPQIAYYLHAAAKVDGTFDVVVPSGNFGNILAAYYAKTLFGAPIRKFVCASNVNDVLTRFIATGTYDPGPTFTVTNSPSMDIRKSSNVERLLWLVNDGDGAAVKKLMDDFAATGRYTLSPAATAKLQAEFVGSQRPRRQKPRCASCTTAAATCSTRTRLSPRLSRANSAIRRTACRASWPPRPRPTSSRKRVSARSAPTCSRIRRPPLWRWSVRQSRKSRSWT